MRAYSLTSILISRFIMDLRTLNNPTYDSESDVPSFHISSVRFAAASVIEDFGADLRDDVLMRREDEDEDGEGEGNSYQQPPPDIDRRGSSEWDRQVPLLSVFSDFICLRSSRSVDIARGLLSTK